VLFAPLREEDEEESIGDEDEKRPSGEPEETPDR
jgi:hypothetical protein